MSMMTSTSSAPPVSGEQAFFVPADVNTYQIHLALEASFGPRKETGYLWSRNPVPGGSLCIVRCPEGCEPPALAENDQWLFRLHGMVTQKSLNDGRQRFFRRGHHAPRYDWMTRRGEEHGFEVVTASVDVARDHVDKPGRPFFLDVSRFTGCLKVTDPNAFTDALPSGIGSGRAFGCGLLQLLKRSV